MKKIVTMLLIGILMLNLGRTVSVSAESPIGYLQEGVETEWTEEKVEADFIQKYVKNEGYISDALPSSIKEEVKAYLYITEERIQVIEKVYELDDTEGALMSIVEDDVEISFYVDEEGRIIKKLFCEWANEEYTLANLENKEVRVSTSEGTKIVRNLLEWEIEEFDRDVMDGLISEESTYSLRDIRMYLDNKDYDDMRMADQYNIVLST